MTILPNMIAGTRFKVCGLTRAEDAAAAAAAGADYLGFIFYPKSPRRIGKEQFRALRPELPDLPKVAVAVAPDIEELDALQALGFDYVQIHFSPDRAGSVGRWSEALGPSRLWLAPKLSPEAVFDLRWLELAGTILWDGYKADPAVFGGTGAFSDWAEFRRLSTENPDRQWILAGGLGPETAAAAIEASGAKILDFNSGLEIAPGVKDPGRISAVREALSRR